MHVNNFGQCLQCRQLPVLYLSVYYCCYCLSSKPRCHLLWEALASLPCPPAFHCSVLSISYKHSSWVHLFITCFLLTNLYVLNRMDLFVLLKNSKTKMLRTSWPSHLLYNTAQTTSGSSFKIPPGTGLSCCTHMASLGPTCL